LTTRPIRAASHAIRPGGVALDRKIGSRGGRSSSDRKAIRRTQVWPWMRKRMGQPPKAELLGVYAPRQGSARQILTWVLLGLRRHSRHRACWRCQAAEAPRLKWSCGSLAVSFGYRSRQRLSRSGSFSRCSVSLGGDAIVLVDGAGAASQDGSIASVYLRPCDLGDRMLSWHPRQ
jgi:hypothetical protein